MVFTLTLLRYISVVIFPPRKLSLIISNIFKKVKEEETSKNHLPFEAKIFLCTLKIFRFWFFCNGWVFFFFFIYIVAVVYTVLTAYFALHLFMSFFPMLLCSSFLTKHNIDYIWVTDKHLLCFHFFTIMKSGAINILVYV